MPSSPNIDIPIFKIKQLENNHRVKAIGVFYGKDYASSSEEERLAKVFSKKELEEITREKIPVHFSEQSLYLDDTIKTVKQKIVIEWLKEVTTDELYLFYQTHITLHPEVLYKRLAKKSVLSASTLETFFSNIPGLQPKIKKRPTLEDLLEMKLENTPYLSDMLLGGTTEDAPFTYNPFQRTQNDDDDEHDETSEKQIIDANSKLLLNCGEIVDNTLYLCLAEDVPEEGLSLYFPALADKKIVKTADIPSQRNTNQAARLAQEKIKKSFEWINLFYDMYRSRKSDLQYIQSGVKYIQVAMTPLLDVKIPLEMLFKTIHATQDTPLIKYNPSTKEEYPRQENMYRLYANTLSTDGRKIPFLNKAVINRQITSIGRTKSLAMYLETRDENVQTLTCELASNGTVTVSAEFVRALDLAKIEELFKKYVNQALTGIQHFLEERGNMFSLFRRLDGENVEIKNIVYQSDIQLKKKFDMGAYKNCISSVFINETSRLKNAAKQVDLRFKRVEYYSAHTSQEAFILDKVNQKMSYGQIIQQLVENYSKDGLDKETASELVQNTLNDLEVIQGARKSDIKIKDNPGFKTVIQLNVSAGFITVTVENINNIHYLQTVPIYLDSLVRLTQNVESTHIPVKDIQGLCSEKFEEEKEEEEEKSVSSQKNAFRLFYGDDEEEDEEDNQEEDQVVDKDKKEEDVREGEEEDKKKPKGTLHLFYDDDEDEEDDEDDEDDEDEEDEEDEEEEEEEDEKEGGKKDDEEEEQEGDDEEDEGEDEGEEEENENNEEDTFRNIDGMKLNKPYYFQKLIEKKDPALIIKADKKGKFNSYVRTCSSSERKQPVILTDAQLNKIKKEHPGFLRKEDVVRYGSTPQKQFNYICPRYWCLKTNTIIDPSELKEVIGKNGKKELEHPTCGKVLPPDESDVLPGYYIYDFGFAKYPGLVPDKHPEGLCLPCCFKKYNTLGRIGDMKKCLNDTTTTTTTTTTTEKAPKEEDEYIKQHDKYPLDKGRWGYLPLELQLMFHEKSIQCQNSKKNIKDNYPCILRHGVERSDMQSFVACFADLLYFGTSTAVPTIEKMKQYILQHLPLEHFVQYQNGNLVTDFQPTSSSGRTVDISQYEKSPLFSSQRHFGSNESERTAYIQRIVSAYENFIAFLKDDTSLIDHTYLWDLVCTPNRAFFPKGVNLVLFEIPDDDITNNVQIVCPTNQYSSHMYDTRRPTVLLVKRNGIYEPIYSYTISKKKVTTITQFDELSPQLSPAIRDVLNKVVKPFFRFVCQPRSSLPSIYKAKHAVLLETLLQHLADYKYTVLQIVSNFHNKIIGVVAQEPDKKKAVGNAVGNAVGFIPCYPSQLAADKKEGDVVMMTDFRLWHSYSHTFSFLKKLAQTSKGAIPCEPAFKVVEDEHVVGILIETNQFVQVSAPVRTDEIAPHQALPTLQNANYIVDKNQTPMKQSEVEIMTTRADTEDHQRVDYVNKIRLDSQYYNVFRNTIRILMNQYKNNKIRKQIELSVQNLATTYSNKLKIVEEFLRALVGDQVQFTGDANYYKTTKHITSCVTMIDANKCLVSSDTCNTTKKDGSCRLILPRKNLITHKDNEKMYYGKMADQLIRYPMIFSFVFKPQNYLYFGDVGYNVAEDEIIMLQSLITQEYFESLVPMKTNQYASQKSYDEVEPLLTQKYDSQTEFFSQSEDAFEKWRNCQRKEQPISSPVWKKCFPPDFQEVRYSDYKHCHPFILQELIKIHTKKKVSVYDLKKELLEEYGKYTTENIARVFIQEGKRGRELLSGEWTLSAYLFSESYSFGLLDFWLLVQRYKIPTVFLSEPPLVGYGEKTDRFAFLSATTTPLSLIQSPQKEVFFTLDVLNEAGKSMLRDALKQPATVEEYLSRGEIRDNSPINDRKEIKEIETNSPNEIIVVKKKTVTKKKNPTMIKPNNKTKKACEEGKERNPVTGRCVNVCKEGEERNVDTGKCEKKKEGERELATQLATNELEKPQNEMKPQDVKSSVSRCPKGTRKNRKTGKCEPIVK
jgi:hypothetical protein